ncbi:uncharacterized protein M421DRAFT_420080 [Didymella exigua CBS 183.55]|uniref:Rhodopsin domain-containing protein n=1 Tax=Didymella exigua CBS 183.55 TaxID=1150837 RepID=A0A6A5RU09_9PLEO|nr:uncharacterized protein M421DRAFT_420080 [Didymella exigua CBS 183.55]KAF1928847.1 hypothetical protein M421DRAFT_420080 [Didymella exigua CBS 183.55]
MILATLFLVIRIYTKVVLARQFSADDGALLLAWAFSVTIQTIILYQYGRGTLGIHIWEIPAHSINSTFNLVSVCSILYCPFLAAAKFSLLFFYLRLSHLRWFRIAVYTSMFLVVGYNIALVFPLIFTCTPVMKNFDIFITDGSCLNRTPLYMATAVLNMATDIMLLLLPIPMIIKLQMSRVQKAGLICIFGVGSATCVTSGVRLFLLFPMLKTIDLTWAIVTPGIWILIEANLVIITGTLPTMRLFFRHVAPRFIGESSMRGRSAKSGASGYGTGYGDGHAGGSKHVESELKTISSKPTRSRYNRMGDDEVSVGSDEIACWRADAGSDKGIISTPVPAELNRKPSKSGIIKTQTTTITSELVPQADERRSSWAPGF